MTQAFIKQKDSQITIDNREKDIVLIWMKEKKGRTINWREKKRRAM